MTFFPNIPPVQHIADAGITTSQVVRITTDGHVVPATASLRFLPFVGIALSSVLSGSPVSVQVIGPVDPNIFSLGAGVACAVGVNSSGIPVRSTDATCVSAPNWIGICDTAGTITVTPVLKEVFDVRDFGAVPDFDYYNNTVHTDNLAAFNATFLAARGFNAGGGITERQTQIVFCPGGYYLSNTLEIPGCFVLQGAGNGDETRTPGTLLAFPINCHGIRLRSTLEIPQPGYNSTFSTIRDMCLYCLGGVGGGNQTDHAPWPDYANTGSGIYSACQVFISDVSVIGFGEDGVSIVANAGPRIPQPAGPIEFAGNADGSEINRVRCAFNGRHGVMLNGADANIVNLSRCQMAVNWGWGYYDVGGGSQYTSCDGSGNGGNFRVLGTIASGSTLLHVANPLVGGTPGAPPLAITSPWIVGAVIAIAGLTGRPAGYVDGPDGMRTITAVDVSTDPATITLDTPADANVTNGLVYGGNIVDIHNNHDYKTGDAIRPAATIFSNFTGCYAEASLNDLASPSMATGGILAAMPTYASVFVNNGGTLANGPLIYDNDRGPVRVTTVIGEKTATMRVLSFQALDSIRNDYLSIQYDNGIKGWDFSLDGASIYRYFTLPTPQSNLRTIAPILREGMFIGEGPDGTALGFTLMRRGDAPPTTDTWVQGDIIWNSAATVGSNIGWVCTVGGTPGTWTPFGTIAVTNEIRSTTISTSLVAGTDHILNIGTLSGIITVTLPAAPTTGTEFIVKDSNGSAATYNITIDGNGHNIDANTTFLLTTDYDSVTVKYNGTKWMVL